MAASEEVVSVETAASIDHNCRVANDPYHSSGRRLVVVENRFRSFMILSSARENGLSGWGIQASVEAPPNDIGSLGRVFDSFRLAGALK